ncbi:MAG: hypothetical protein JOZ04_10670 [Acidimicrobiia bacterium]|nr:hypothetical protein [Acidimicrobiia bacterium]
MALGLVALSVWSGARARPRDAAVSGGPGKVVVFGFSGLGWDDLQHGPVPNLRALAARGAVAAMTVRTVSPQPSLAEGYATLGAGARLRAPAADVGPVATDGGGAPITVSGVRHLARVNRSLHLPTGPGALGDALGAAGRRTAVVDQPGGTGAAALALMDHKGSVDAGWQARVPGAPTAGDLTAALGNADVVVVEPGQLALAGGPSATDPDRTHALVATDQLLGDVERALPPGTRLLVVSVVPPSQTWHLEPVVVAGAGVPQGYVDSPSTKRLGLVTLTDVAPTVLAWAGAPIPSAMIGRQFRYHSGPVSMSRLAGLDADGRARASTYPSIGWGFVALHAVAYLLAAWVLWRRRGGWAARLVRYALLGIVAFPLASYLIRLLPPAQWHGVLPLGLAVVDFALVAVASRAKSHPLAPLGILAAMTVVVLVADMATGARLQVNSLLGYAPLSADRFFGIGGTTLGVLAAAAVVAAAVFVSRARDRRHAAVLVGAAFFVIAALAGSPLSGAKVGAILTMVPVFVVATAAFYGRRVTWRLVLLAVVATAVALALAALFDALQPATGRAHLGQLVGTTGASGGHSILTTVARKATTDARVFIETVWSWVALIIVVFIAYLLMWDHRFRRILPVGSAVRVGALAALAAAVLGLVFNDTGIIITALVLVYLGPYLTLLALGASTPRPAAATMRTDDIPNDRAGAEAPALS